MTSKEPKHDRNWIIGCIKHDGFIKTDRGDKANQIILEALQAEPVKQGEWEYHNYSDINNKYQGYFVCSVCGYHEHTKHYFCPNCGAKMDGGKDEK